MTSKGLSNKNWTTGSGDIIDLKKMIKISKQHIESGSKVFIGSDSFINNNKVTFATSLCLSGGQEGNRYFFYKEREFSLKYNLVSRITEEARKSLELADYLVEKCNINFKNIEIHLDVSPPFSNHGTSRFSEMLTGYVLGHGFLCKVKPDAWASQSVADRHSK